MKKLNYLESLRRGRMLSAIGLLVAAAPVLYLLADATPSGAQAPAQQAQGAAAAAPVVYEYEVVSIKPNKSGSAIPGGRQVDDGINVTNFPLQFLILGAFGVSNDRILGLPGWVTSDRFDINAKMSPEVADALKKLSSDDRKETQQHMLQALFADRCKMTFHRETKEMQTYALVVGKNGPKFIESKSGDAPAGAIKVPDGKGGTGSIQVGQKGAITFRGLPVNFIVQILSVQLGRTVVDKTGLTAKYDFTWQFTPSAAQIRQFGGAAPDSASGNSTGIPSDPDGTDLFTAVQEQLGLKLESAKGPIEVFVIDHMEKPSDN
jgi:uncharacterized protein (TIGR03435 family)